MDGYDNPEDAYKHIATHALGEFKDILSSCTTGGKPWAVEAPISSDLIEDYEDIKAVYASGEKACKSDKFQKLRNEAADI